MTAADLLLIRVDAGPDVGTGHAMRCLALAQGWKDGHGEVVFAQAETLPAFEERVRREGIPVVSLSAEPGSPADAKATADLARERHAAWTVLDGYRFDGRFQEAIVAAGSRLLAIDDFGHAGSYPADLVLNQNAGAEASLYSKKGEHTQLLLGPRYVLLRRTVRAGAVRDRSVPPTASRVLVTFGGVDSHDLTSKTLRGLGRTKLPNLQVRVIVGPGNPHVARLEAAVKGSHAQVRLERDPGDMAGLMAWADLAIAGAGTTSWELAYLGVPSLLVATADNQRSVAENLAAAGACVSLGWYEDVTEDRIADAVRRLASDAPSRQELSRRGRELVDGEGVPRVVTAMKAGLVQLRPVVAGDARVLWEWANDRTVRAVSFTTGPIPWDDHVRWLEQRLRDPSTVFLIALGPDGEPLGQIRFDIHEEEAEVSVSLDAKSRGRGYGSAVILAGSRKLFGSSRIQTLHAYVKDGNEPSVRAFLRAGYARNGRANVRGHDAVWLTFQRQDAP